MNPETDGAQPRFEDRLKELEDILRRLERGDLTLDQSVAEYERGIAALRSCREVLDRAEKRIEEIVRVPDRGEGAVELRPFPPQAR